MGGDVKRKTDRLLDLALAHPSDAIEQATSALESGLGADDRVVALRARGLARRQLGELDESESDLNHALDLAKNDSQLWAGVALTMAGTRVYQGRIGDAMGLLEQAIAKARGLTKTEALFQLGTTQAQSGDVDAALDTYATALPQIRKHARLDWESQLLGNRGIIAIMSGDHRAAVADLDRAIELQIELDIPAQAALNMHNKAQALYMLGDIAGSLDLYEHAEELLGELGLPVLMHAQKCDAYLAAGMFEECLTLAGKANAFHRSGQTTMGQILTMMLGAEAALSLRRFEQAEALATAAAEVEGAENFPSWIGRAELTLLEARLRHGTSAPGDEQRALEHFSTVERSDSVASARALLLASEIAIEFNRKDAAHEHLARAARIAARAPLHLQIERWKILAQLRAAQGNRRGALAAVDAGLRAFARLLHGVYDYSMRVRATRHAEALSTIGLAAHVATGRLDRAVALVENVRGASLQLPRGPIGDVSVPMIAAEARLRRGEQDAVSDFLRLQREPLTSREGGSADARPRPDDLVVTFVELDGEMLALWSAPGAKTTVHRCGLVLEVVELVERQGFGFRQLARRSRLSNDALHDLESTTVNTSTALGELLFEREFADQSRVLINPSDALADVIWGALPQLSTRAHVICPGRKSIAHEQTKVLRSTLALGSSELDYVGTELRAVASAADGRHVLDPLRTVVAELEDVDVLHVAGHFYNAPFNPALSEIPLGEFSLRGADYLELRSPPSLVVLSACGTGETQNSGGTPFGFATAVLAAGTASVVVTQTLIEDGDSIVRVMRAFHEHIAAGATPENALMQLRQGAEESDQMAARSLVVMGTG